MSMSDTIADLLTRIRNGQSARKVSVAAPFSKFKINVLEVLKAEGYIKDFKKREVRKGIYEIDVDLKYYENEPVIQKIQRVSKPGCRIYSSISDLKPISNGLGVSILSTPRGVMSDVKARELNVGGEVICQVF